ncbi:MAG: hypothetical protein ACYSUJ_12850, partial [Planctomycetota bacterium]
MVFQGLNLPTTSTVIKRKNAYIKLSSDAHMIPPLFEKPVFAGFLFFRRVSGLSRRADFVGKTSFVQ